MKAVAAIGEQMEECDGGGDGEERCRRGSGTGWLLDAFDCHERWALSLTHDA
jgi:hypothetical protein